MKKVIKIIIMVICFISLTKWNVWAEDKGMLTITGVMSEDVIICYELASYDESGNLIWSKELSEWMNKTNMFYEVSILSENNVTNDNKCTEFGKKIIEEIQSDEKWTKHISCQERIGATSYYMDLPSGVYMVCINGCERIYDMKVVHVMPLQTTKLDYTSESYNNPDVNIHVINSVKDRMNNEQQQVWTRIDDVLEIQAVINLPFFYDIYKETENCLNKIVVFLPVSVDYKKDSLNVYEVNGDTESKLQEEAEFDLVHKESVSVYKNHKQQIVFYKDQQNHFYDLNNTCLSKDNLEDALYSYNTMFDMMLDKNELEEVKGVQILEITLNKEISKLKISCKSKKNAFGDKNGVSYFEVIDVYSRSLISPNVIGKSQDCAGICYYGVKFVCCEGDGIADLTDEDGILKNAKRLSNATVELYEYHSTVVEDEQNSLQKKIIELGEMKYYIIDSAQANSKDIYVQVGVVHTDNRGEAILGGLDINEYLVIESKAPQGYDFYSSFIKIPKEKWNEISSNEDSYLLRTLLINYYGMTLPGFGECSEWKYWAIGGAIVVIAIVVRVRVEYVRVKKRRERDYCKE